MQPVTENIGRALTLDPINRRFFFQKKGKKFAIYKLTDPQQQTIQQVTKTIGKREAFSCNLALKNHHGGWQ